MQRPAEKVAMHVNQAVASTIPERALYDLNWMRGLAAIAVLVGHVRGAYFVDLQRGGSPLYSLAYFLTGLGHQAVIVFFVLSGFFIGTSVVATSRDGTWSWQRYALRRFTRLYVVLLPALLLTALWDSAGMALFGRHGIYGGTIGAPFLALPDVRDTLTLPVFLGNVAFLQEMFVRPFGSDGPLWSLGYEFWSYLVFPLFFRAVVGSASAGLRALSASCGVALLLIGGPLMRFYFCVWALGALVAIVWNRRRIASDNRLAMLAATGFFVCAVAVGRVRLLNLRRVEDLTVGVATALFIVALLARGAARHSSPERPFLRTYARWGNVIAGFSYTLYAGHYPVLTFLHAWLVGPTRWDPSPVRVSLAASVCFAIIVLYAYPLARVTEARTDEVRRWIERLFVRATA